MPVTRASERHTKNASRSAATTRSEARLVSGHVSVWRGPQERQLVYASRRRRRPISAPLTAKMCFKRTLPIERTLRIKKKNKHIQLATAADCTPTSHKIGRSARRVQLTLPPLAALADASGDRLHPPLGVQMLRGQNGKRTLAASSRPISSSRRSSTCTPDDSGR